MKTRLEKATNGLKQIAERYSKQDLSEFSGHKIKIKPQTDKAAWLWFYVTLLILTPIGFCVYLLTQRNADSLTIVLLIGLAAYFGITLYSLLHGQQTLTVDLLQMQFILENVHKVFTRQKDPVFIDFSKVKTVTLKQKAIRYNNRWTRISFLDANANKLAYIDLGADFPDSIISEKVKFFLGVVLWTYNEKHPKSA